MPIQDIPLTNKMHAVPQNFMDVEFKLIGDLTMRQFTYLMVGGVAAYLTYSTVGGVFKWPFVLFFVLLGLSFAFLPIQERGLDVWLVNLFKAIYSPTLRIWKKEPVIPSALLYENLNVVKQELITLAPTSSRRKLEEYLQYQYKKDDEDPLDIPEMEFVSRVKNAFAQDVALATVNATQTASPAVSAPAQFGSDAGQVFGRQIGQQLEQWGFRSSRDISSPPAQDPQTSVPEPRVPSEPQVQPTQTSQQTQPEPQTQQKPAEPNVSTPATPAAVAQKAPIAPEAVSTPPQVVVSEPKVETPQAPSAQDLLGTHPIKETRAAPVAPQPEVPSSTKQQAPVQLDWKYPTGVDAQKKTTPIQPPDSVKPEPIEKKAETESLEIDIEKISPFKKLLNMFTPTASVATSEPSVPASVPVVTPTSIAQAPVAPKSVPEPSAQPVPTQPQPAPEPTVSDQPVSQPVAQPEQKLHSFKTVTPTPTYQVSTQQTQTLQPGQPVIKRHSLLRNYDRLNKPASDERILAPMTPDMHSGRKFTNLVPSKGELVLPIRGERVLKTSEDLNTDESAKEKALKLEQIRGQFKNSKDAKNQQTQNTASIPEVMERVTQNMSDQTSQIPIPVSPQIPTPPIPQPVAEKVSDTKKDVFDDAQQMIEKLKSENEKLQNEIDKLKTELSQQAQSSDEANKKEIISRLEQQKQKNSADYSTLVRQIHELRTRLTQKEKPQQEEAPKRPETIFANIQPLTSAPNVITGVVVDQDGKTLEGVLLIIKNDKGDPVRAIKTNKIGQFVLSTPVLNGIYTIEVNSGKIEGQSFGIISVETKGEVLPPVEIRGRKE